MHRRNLLQPTRELQTLRWRRNLDYKKVETLAHESLNCPLQRFCIIEG
jgi:hypothetical protein